jgi:hypothetical protein
MERNSRKLLQGTVLGLVLLQAGAWFSGCGQAGASSAAGGASASASNAQPAANRPLPVRVSRSFFGSEVSGAIRVQGGAAQPSAVRWTEANTSADHPGCARLTDAGGVELCFNLMNDVDSFGVNEREMSVSGLESYLAERLGEPCPGVAWSVSLSSASRLPAAVSSREVTSFHAAYVAQPAAGSGCQAEPVSVELSFQR